jgi:subtilisin family serine protease
MHRGLSWPSREMLLLEGMMKKSIAFTLVVSLCALPFPATYAQGQKNTTAANAANSVPGELLVQFHPDADDASQARALGRIGGEALEIVRSHAMNEGARGDLVLVRFQPDLPQKAAIRALKDDPAVEFSEPNWIYTHQTTSNDPYYTGANGYNLWGMYGDATAPANLYGSQAGEAWATGNTGDNAVYVGIIDEGIQYTHPDLVANHWENPGEAPGNGKDDDGNGYVDDIYGWDFDGNNNTIYDGGSKGTLDDHGTHVAGTIAGVGGNGIGVAGVSWGVTYISAKFLGRRGGTTANAIRAVDYLTDLKTRHGLNLVATNNSWGGGGFSQALLDAINRGGNAGILFIAAAGNGGSDGTGDNNDTTTNYPSNYVCTTTSRSDDCVIAVAAITSTGALASFSNYGAARVDLGAPGSGIWSTTAYNTYSSYSGTSMATPHVTGAAALYASTHPGATAAQIKAAILNSAVPTASLAGKTVTGGRLNVSGF